ncbi:hypothetical protein PUR61_35695 [Streptomyces sp. BE20]|nr:MULTISPECIES: hypothetical protein [unclassified Streptomyces]MEE1827492.1 hypothetical protein [Streptomyces sp. BE20]
MLGLLILVIAAAVVGAVCQVRTQALRDRHHDQDASAPERTRIPD